MDTNQTHVYHVVQLLPTQGDSLNCVYCVPASWVRWQDEESTKVLVAYPNESSEITSERVKIYESPGGYWNLYWAQIKYTANFYDSIIRSINEREHSVEESSSGKVICTEMESSNSSTSIKASLSPEIKGSNTFWPELHRWFHDQPNFDEPQLSIVDRTDEGIRLDSEELDQYDVDGEDSDVPLDLSLSSKTVQKSTPRSLQDSRHVNNINDLHTIKGTEKYLIVKHREYAPGLFELITGSGVYIAEKELDHCLASSRKSTELARYLTKNIFTTAALHDDSQNSLENHQLKLKASSVIVKFVLNYGIMRKWSPSCEKSLRGAIWYQKSLLKKNP